MYDISYKGTEGQSGLYARIQRTADSKWWDEVADSWIATATADCNLTLTEGATAGAYTGQADCNPAEGGIYKMHVYDSLDALVSYIEDVYKSGQLTALQIVNEVQKALRLPQSTLITEAHAQLVLSFLNEMQEIIMEAARWPELDLKGGIVLKDGFDIFRLYPTNTASVDIVKRLQIGNSAPLTLVSDEDFREAKRLVYTTDSQPMVYRIYSRAGGVLYIQVAAVPDQDYTVDFEALQKPERLINATDVPILDASTLILGGIAKAKDEQGTGDGLSLEAFKAKLSGQSGNQGDINEGDVVPV